MNGFQYIKRAYQPTIGEEAVDGRLKLLQLVTAQIFGVHGFFEELSQRCLVLLFAWVDHATR